MSISSPNLSRPAPQKIGVIPRKYERVAAGQRPALDAVIEEPDLGR